MNNNSVQINRYLQNEMTAEERTAFEEMLATDKELRHELQVQQQVIKAVVNAGLKNEFAKAIRHRVMIRRMITWSAVAAVFVGIILVLNFKGNISPDKLINPGNITGQQIADILSPFVNPPLAGINVPLSEYSLDAEKGGTLYYKSGSVIYFPPSSLVDAAGNPVKGVVKVTYREFADPLDFFVSGIPMQYDSAGTKYNFESSGMCEINAYKDNKAVFVNQHAKPEINLSGTNKSPLHNLYFLDTANRKWEYNGKDIITEVKKLARQKTAATTNIVRKGEELTLDYEALPTKPLMPRKASEDHPKFRVEINPVAFEELHAYDGLQFEVVDERNYHASDANEQWATMQLERTSVEGIYDIVFINSARKVTYKVRPVLEGADYDAALKVFKEKNKAYELALSNRVQSDRLWADSINMENTKLTEKMNDDKKWNDKMNVLIIARNKLMKELQQKAIANEEKAAQALQIGMLDQFLKMTPQQLKVNTDLMMANDIMRSFSINNFGIWNCDHPEYPNNEIPLAANYTDSSDNNISFPNIAVVYKGFNGITQFPAQMPIRVIPGKENMLWGIIDSSFYYFSYNDFVYTRIGRNTRSFTFKMRKAGKQITSYEEIRELVEKL